MRKQMCAQIEVLKKIRKKGKVNGYDVDLAEAQAKDYMQMKARLDNIEADVSVLKTDVASIKTEQAVQGNKLDMLIKAVQSNQEDANRYRLLVDIWRALFGSTKKTVLTFLIFGIIVGFVNIKDVIELLRSII